MKEQKAILKTIDINGKPIYYLVVGGINYILIRPLCEALGVDADWQIRTLRDDEILGAEVCEHTTQLPADTQRRNHVCLPEEFIYGWIFGIKYANTMSEETRASLITYKRECYDALYQHFHRRIMLANETLQEKALVEVELKGLRKELIAADPRFVRYDELLTIRQQLSYRISQSQKAQLNIFVEMMNNED